MKNDKILLDYNEYQSKIKENSNEEFFSFFENYLKLAFGQRRAKKTNSGLSSFIKTKEGNIHFRLKFDKNKIIFKIVFKDGRVLRGVYVKRENYDYMRIKDDSEKKEIRKDETIDVFEERKEIVNVFDKKGFQTFGKSMFDKVSYNIDNNDKKIFRKNPYDNRTKLVYNYRIGNKILQKEMVRHHLEKNKVKDCSLSYILDNENYKEKKLIFEDKAYEGKEISNALSKQYLRVRAK
ncbi:MAG: hypothetical protein ACI4PE_03640 [Bacilli bacterium]